MTYSEWIAAVDDCVANWVGLCLDDLPDWLSRDAFDEGLSPEEGAEQALVQTGFYSWAEALRECDAD